MKVTLNDNEMAVGAFVGIRRNTEAMANNRTHRFPEQYAGQAWVNHIEGAMAEIAVAKYLGLYWGFGVNTFVAPDIENTDIEIRWSPKRNDMKVKANDNGVVVCVSGQSPNFVIKGWLKASDAKKDEYYYASPPPCWFVPHAKLHGIDKLKNLLRKRLIQQ